MFWLDGMVDCGDLVLYGSTQHLKMGAVGQRKGWSHPKAKPGEYEDAYELSLERSWLIYINTDLSLLLY